jgi:glutathione-independent formaldehyde dehydrogenase
VAGAGPVGLACAEACRLLGAAVVIVGDMNPDRLKQARSFGCETIDLREDAALGDRIEQILGVPEVLNSLMTVTRAGGALGIPGLYVTDDPGSKDEKAKSGVLGIRIGLGWAKSHTFATGQCPVMRYHRQLMMAILHGRTQPAKAVNATVIPLEDAPRGYTDFDKGAARKFVLDPHGLLAA